MKRVLIVLVIVVSIVVLGTGFIGKSIPVTEPENVKKHCTGYVVIEANTGINCYGDTIRLIKKHGFYEVETFDGRTAVNN